MTQNVNLQWWQRSCWENPNCYNQQCADDLECFEEYMKWFYCTNDTNCEYYDQDQSWQWEGCWGTTCDICKTTSPLVFATFLVALTWWSLFSSWGYYQTGSAISDIWWWLNLCLFAPIQILFSLVVIVVAGIDDKYMATYYKTLASFLIGLIIYFAYLSPNLQWYHLNKQEGAFEELESAFTDVGQTIDEVEKVTNEIEADM